MKAIGLFALLFSVAAFADKLEYLGRDETGAAQVQHAKGKQTVRVGDEIPGWGRVHAADDESLQVVRRLTDDERKARRDKGQIPVDAELMIVPRSDRRTVPITPGN